VDHHDPVVEAFHVVKWPDGHPADSAAVVRIISALLADKMVSWSVFARRVENRLSGALRETVVRLQEADARQKFDLDSTLEEWFVKESKYPAYANGSPGRLSNDPNWAALSNDRMSMFLGTIHRTRHPQTEMLHREITAWFERTAGDERVLLIEGPVGRTEEYGYKTVNDAMEHGEMAMADFLAHEQKVTRISLREDPAEEVKALLGRGISPEMLFFHNIIREIPVAIRWGIDPGSYALKFVDEYKFVLKGNATKDITTEDAVRQFNSTLMDLYGDGHRLSPSFTEQGGYREAVLYPFDAKDERWILNEQGGVLLNPHLGPLSTPLEQVSLEVHRRKEEYVIETLGSYMDDGYRCLALYGQFHMPYILQRMPQFAASDLIPLTP
jgi:hypothetical protein